MRSNADNLIVFCTGLPRSASTWSYNVCRYLLRNEGAFRPELCGYLGTGTREHEVDTELRSLARQPGKMVLKFHFPGPYARGLLKNQNVKNIFTHRDPRDAIASRMAAFGYSFADALAELVQITQYLNEFKKANSLFLAYDRVRSDTSELVLEIADYLGLEVLPTQAISIANDLSLQNTKKLIETNLKPDPIMLHDMLWLYHKSHITNGTSGYWRERLSNSEAQKAKDSLATLFKKFDYS